MLSVAGKVGEVSTGGSNGSSSSSGDHHQQQRAAARTRRRRSTVRRPSGTGFIVIANLSQLAVTANIAEADAAKVQLGQPARVTFPGDERHRRRDGHADHAAEHADQQRRAVPRAGLAGRPRHRGSGWASTASMSITTGSEGRACWSRRRRRSPRSATGTRSSSVAVSQDVVVPVEIGLVGDTTTEIIRRPRRRRHSSCLPTVSTSTTNGFPGGGGGGG